MRNVPARTRYRGPGRFCLALRERSTRLMMAGRKARSNFFISPGPLVNRAGIVPAP